MSALLQTPRVQQIRDLLPPAVLDVLTSTPPVRGSRICCTLGVLATSFMNNPGYRVRIPRGVSPVLSSVPAATERPEMGPQDRCRPICSFMDRGTGRGAGNAWCRSSKAEVTGWLPSISRGMEATVRLSTVSRLGDTRQRYVALRARRANQL